MRLATSARFLPAILAGVFSVALGVSDTSAAIFNEGFSGSTVMSTNPAAPTAASTDYAVLSTKGATGSSIGTTLDLTIPGTSSGLAEIQALFADSAVTVDEGETLRFQMTFEGTYLIDGGDSSGSVGSQVISFGLYNSGGSYPVPGGALASGDLGLKEDGAYASGYAADWQGYVGYIGNASQSSVLMTREPQADSWNESQDAVFGDGVTGGYDTPDGTGFASGAAEDYADGIYTMILDISKTGSVMKVDQYLYAGEGTGGSVVYSISGSESSYLYDTFDALAFGFRGRAGSTIHMNVSSLEIGFVDTSVPSVTGLGDLSVLASQSITLEPVITGSTPLSIQWSSNSVVLADETGETLELNNIQLSQDGTVYSVVVSNAYGTASGSMTLSVAPAPEATGLYNIQLNYGDGSATYTGAAQIGSTNDIWNNPLWDGVGTTNQDLFAEYVVDSAGGNVYGVTATLTPDFNDGYDWDYSGDNTFNHYSGRDDGSPNPTFMEKVVKIDNKPVINPLTLTLCNLPTNTEFSVYLYGSGNKQDSGFACSLAAANTNEGVYSAMVMYDTTSTNAATGRDVTLATSQGLSWEVLSGTTGPTGTVTIVFDPPGTGNANNQIFIIGAQLQLDLPNEEEPVPTVDPIINSIAVSGSIVTLSWTAEDIGTYSIQRKTDLSGETWSTVVSNLPAGDLTTNVTTSGSNEEFYQVIGE